MSPRRNDADGIVHRFLRLSQTLVPAGVGGILDLDGESFMACDVRHWEHPRVLGSERLRRALRVDEICEAPHGEGGSGAPFFRFPRWLFCEQCQHMYLWPRDRDQTDGGRPVCPRCPGERWLTPMRWVAACPEGHIQDVDWQRWAHARSKKPGQRNCQSLKLKFHTIAGGGTGIDKLAITCTECGSWRSLRGLTREDALKGVGVSCEGRQPWEPETSACAEDVLVIQRGATNLQFAKTASAIEIPPESHFDPMGDLALCVRGHGLYYTLASGQAGPIAETLARQIAEFCQTDEETVLAIARQGSGGPEAASSTGSDLHEEEWLALVKEGGEPNPLDTFVTEPVTISGLILGSLPSGTMRMDRGDSTAATPSIASAR